MLKVHCTNKSKREKIKVNMLALRNRIQNAQMTYREAYYSQSIVSNLYYESIDEFRACARELKTNDFDNQF